MHVTTAIWLAIGIVALTFEFITLAKRKGTLTSKVKWLRARFWGELIVTPSFAWLTYHWWIDYGFHWIFDIVSILVGVGIVFLIQKMQWNIALRN